MMHIDTAAGERGVGQHDHPPAFPSPIKIQPQDAGTIEPMALYAAVRTNGVQTLVAWNLTPLLVGGRHA